MQTRAKSEKTLKLARFLRTFQGFLLSVFISAASECLQIAPTLRPLTSVSLATFCARKWQPVKKSQACQKSWSQTQLCRDSPECRFKHFSSQHKQTSIFFRDMEDIISVA